MTPFPESSVEPPFPIQMFGNSVVGHMLNEIVRVEKLPPDFVAPFLLGAVSSSAARGLQVESFRGKCSLPNLYIALEAESGIGKSEVGKHAFGPLFDVDALLRERFRDTELPKFSARHRLQELAIQKIEKKEQPDESELQKLFSEKASIEKMMTSPKLIVEDCTQEALELAMSQQKGVLALISTDARKVIKNLLGRHRKGQADEDFYIKCWSGDIYVVDRISRSNIPPVRDPCLAMFLAVQPDLFRTLASHGELLESGFFTRLLPVTQREIQHCGMPSNEAYNPAIRQQYGDHLRSVFQFYRGVERPHTFSQSLEARQILDNFYAEVSGYIGKDPGFASCYRRWAEQACRIAVCLQVAIWGRAAHTGPLHPYCAEQAVVLMRWFGSQQRQMLSRVTVEKQSDLRQCLVNLVHRSGEDGVSVRDAWKELNSTSEVVKGLVAQCAELKLVSKPTGGRPSEVIVMMSATPGL